MTKTTTKKKRKIAVKRLEITSVPIVLVADKHVENLDGSQEYEARVSDVVEIEHVCACEDYDGQDYFCTIHSHKTECPRCRCIDAELPMTQDSAIKSFRCRICGIFYFRNLETGDIGIGGV